MIPILYASSETAFATNGKGRLTDIISCSVTEERNGVYELEFVYPVNGKLYSELLNGGIVACFHDDTHTVQPFDLYKHTAPLDGKVTFNARHIRYRQANIILKPFTGSSCSDVMSKIVTNSANTNPFTYSTDKATSGTFTLDRPRSVQSLLMGEEGSILDVYGKGDYEFDRFNVILHANRGVDSGVTIRYGKNLAALTDDYSEDGVFTAVAPYWAGNDTVVYPSEVIVTSPNAPAAVVPVTLDLSGAFQDKPTQAQLRTEARRQLNAAEPWLPTRNIKIDFVALWQTTEYANVAVLERLALCDTVSVIYENLGVNVKQKVIKTVYDVLAERYSEMELGSTSETLGEAITQSLNKRLKQMASISFMRDAVADATAQITGGLGGYVVLKLNAARQPEELLIMDTPDTSTAVNVWRWNMGGLGHSSTGYNGPFNDVAITQDGKINANLIKAGTLDGDIVKVRNLQIIDSNGNTISSWNSNGITLGKTTESHAVIDFAAFDLFDKTNNRYLHFGDARNAAGRVNVQLITYENAAVMPYVSPVLPGLYSVTSVYVGGQLVDPANYTYDTTTQKVTINPPVYVVDTEVEIRYVSTNPVYVYTLGTRESNNYYTGAQSLTVGREIGCPASDSFAAGLSHHVSGEYDAAIGGQDADIRAYNSVTLGGKGLRARSASQTVLGEYNRADRAAASQRGEYVEIVGNGTVNTRSNARTLDWFGNEWLAGQMNADTANFRNGATSSGNVDITGGYVLRRLPAVPTAGTGYWLARVTESNGTTGRGGVQFLPGAPSGDGIRMIVSDTVNGSTVSHILALYLDSNGNRAVAVSDKAAWQAGLGLVYVAGDTVTMGSYDRFAGDWRDATNLWFQIPLTKPVASGVSASLSGSVIVISNGTRATVTLANVTQTCRVTTNGIVVNLTWSSAPSFAVAFGLANVQAYGATITFS